MQKFAVFLCFVIPLVLSQGVITDYFYLGDASNVFINSEDGRSQFFDYTGLLELPFNITHQTFHPWDQVIRYLLVNYSMNVPGNQIEVQSAKVYSKYAGSLPKKLVIDEITRSDENKWYTSGAEATAIFFKYIMSGDTVPADQDPYQIQHEVVEVCTRVKTGNPLRDLFTRDYRHFLIDRGSHGALPDIWPTRIRFIYTGKSSNCDLNDSAWADKRAGTYNASGVVKPQMNLIDSSTVSNYNIGNLLDDCYSYFDHFPLYNTLYNCQHFATNLYNKLAKRSSKFFNEDVMLIKYANGTTNANKLKFEFPAV